MRLAATIFAALALLGCTGENAGQSPVAPVESPRAFLNALIVDGSGECIEGATLRVIAGQRAGESFAQQTPCHVWCYDGGGVPLTGLTAGVAMTFQASAPGYQVNEKRVIPSSKAQTAVEFVLSRDR